MTLRVIRPGLLTTVQDPGRWGRQQYGVVVGGAMDRVALRLANLLVGNAEHDAALEVTLTGPELEFQDDALIALCGADLSPTVDGAPVPTWRPVVIRAGSILAFGKPVAGCRAYLALAGGLDTPLVLGSRGTYLRAGIGGYEGRALKAGDVLHTRPASNAAVARLHRLLAERGERRWSAPRWFVGAGLADYAANPILRVMRGSELDWLAPESREQLFSAEFTVTEQSDRMGYRLRGPKLTFPAPRELLSEAVCPGTIQVPPEGQPIVLMADCATTGGYPKAAHVASVDLPVLAQLRPGAKLRFQSITIEEAQDLIRAREATIQRIKHGVSLQQE